MLDKLVFTHSYFSYCPTRKLREPRQRFINYYRDLFALQNKAIDLQTFKIGSQYSYTELGDQVLSKYSFEHCPEEVELIILIVWAHEFDPEYASCTAYFVDRYAINAEIVDICDYGILGFFAACCLLQRYIETANVKVALILLLEQTTIPFGDVKPKYLPTVDFSFAIRVEKIQNNLILPNQVVLVDAHVSTKKNIEQKLLPSDQGCYPLSNKIHKFINFSKQNKLFISQLDCESENIGTINLRKGA